MTTNRIKALRPERRRVMATPHAANGANGANGHATAATPPLAPVADGPAKAPRGGKDAATGRFTAGNQFGRGNPHARRQAAFHKALMDAVTPDGVQAVAAALWNAAKNGDVAAAGLLLSYLIGRPRPAPDADRLDLDEFALAAAAPSLAEVARADFDNLDPAAAAALVRSAMAGRAGVPVGKQGMTPEEGAVVHATLKRVHEEVAADEDQGGALDLQIGELRKARCKRAK